LSGINQSLPHRKTKSYRADKGRPPIILPPGATEQNIVAVNLNRYGLRKDPPEGAIILKTEHGKAKKIPHELADLLVKTHRNVRIMDLGPKGSNCLLPQGRRNPPGILKGDPENRLRHLQGEVVSGGFIIAGHEHLPFPRREIPQLTRLGFAPKEPIEPGKSVIKSLM